MFSRRDVQKRQFSFKIGNRLPLVSFFLSGLILEIAYITLGIFPFGSRSLLIIDLYHQYAPFLSELQHKLTTGSSLFYSWSGGLGTDFYSTYAYYLASPMNLLIGLFAKDNITEAVLLLTLIKIGLSGAFFTVYLKEAYGKKDVAVVAFSLMYSLSGYIMAYAWNIMWLEGIYLMPLIILGLIRLIRQGRALLYTISLGLLLFSNFYIAFFVVFFIVLYYPVLLIQFMPDKSAGTVTVKTLQTAAFSILALGLAAVMIVPTVYALGLTSAAGSSFPTNVEEYFNLFDFIGRHFPLADAVIREGMPNLYCGFAVLVLVPLYFLGRRFSRAEKIANGALVFILIASFNLNVLNYLWHGFHFPNQLPFRNSFVYIFLIVTLAYRGFHSRPEFSGRLCFGLTALAAGILLVVQKLNDKQPGFPEIYVILFMIGLFAIAFTLRQDGDFLSPGFMMVFSAVVVIELVTSTIWIINKVDSKEYYSSRSGYLAGPEIAELFTQIGEIKKKETGFYRMEILPSKTSDDPYLYNYNGVSIFSSMMPNDTVATMSNLGFNTNSLNSYLYKGTTPVMNSLLGIKYLISRQAVGGSFMNSIYAKDKLTVYENPDALPVGYFAPESIKQWNSTSSPFTTQNSLVKNLTGVEDLFSSIKTSAGTAVNADIKPIGSYRYNFTRGNAGSESRFSIKLEDTADKYVYLYYETQPNKIDYGYVMLGGKRLDFDAKRSTIVDVGFCRSNETVTLELVYKADSDIDGSFGVYADVMDEPRYREAMDTLRKNSLKIGQFTDTRVDGTVDAAEPGVLFTTIPYHKGWSVTVDGIKAETFAVDNSFLAFEVPEGRHTVSMSYMTPYFSLGGTVTLASLVFLFVGIALRWRFFRS